MIQHNTQNKNTENAFSNAIHELNIRKILRQSNIRKSCGIPVFEVFQFYHCLYFRAKIYFAS